MSVFGYGRAFCNANNLSLAWMLRKLEKILD